MEKDFLPMPGIQSCINYLIGFSGDGPSRRRMIVDHQNKRVFVRLDSPDCERGPFCSTCSERVAVAQERGFEIFVLSQKIYLSGTPHRYLIPPGLYTEIAYIPVVTEETLRATRMPFPGEVSLKESPRGI